MDWNREKHHWPNAESSTFVETQRCRFHVQQTGEGPVMLLLHGTGATTHSFAGLMPLLATSFRVIACDLPGHGFSSGLRNQRSSLPNVARAVSDMLVTLKVKPDIIVGHSAGAAIAVEMTGSGLVNPAGLVSINGAFYPFPGFSGEIFPTLARMLFLNPFVPKFFAFSASSRARVERLINATGSKLDSGQIELYQRAFQSADHVEGTLALMANWDLSGMATRLQKLEFPMLQIIGKRDRTINPQLSDETVGRLKYGCRVIMDDAGHLAHEENPQEVCRLIVEFSEKVLGKGARKLA